jgi:hypothetical protein
MIVSYGEEIERLRTHFSRLNAEFERMQHSTTLEQERLSNQVQTFDSDIVALKTWISRPLDSKIITSFPSIFDEFRGKTFSLLWRGSRDGFGAQHFHDRCDGHCHTITIILDTSGNIFGGFTPLSWESRIWNEVNGTACNLHKADPNLSSFIFTLHNPHNTPGMKFRLRLKRCEYAILCESVKGPRFGYGWPDISIQNNCNTGPVNHTKGFGHTYDIDNCSYFPSGVNSSTFLTGSPQFTVREIEVFKIIDFE